MTFTEIRHSIGQRFRYIDKTYWLVFFFLVVFAIIELFSASSTLAYQSGSMMGPITKQIKFIIAGAALAFVVQLLPSQFIRKVGYFGLAVSILFLYVMLVPGNPFVSNINSADRWIKIFGVSFQPSELAKFNLIIVVADQLANATDEQDLVKRFYTTLALSLLTILPIFLGNLSTALLLAAIVFMLWVIARVPWRYTLSVVGIAAVILVSGYFIVEFGFVRPHRAMSDKNPLKRSVTWVMRVDRFIGEKTADDDAPVVITDENRQRTHATLAIARGGASPFGVLPGNSVERNFLSQAFADYIFAIIVEETGLVGAIALIALYVIILFRACFTSARNTDYGSMLMVMGLALMLALQAFVSMAVSAGIGPVTGQPLPMVSRGGTSVIVTSFYFAVLMCVSREQAQREALAAQTREKSFKEVPEFEMDS